VFSIVDYKSGASARTTAKATFEGYSLQLPLYALAAQNLLAALPAVPWSAAYWHVAGKGYQEVIAFHADADGGLQVTPEWETFRTDLTLRVRSLIEGIRQGQFPMHSVEEDCTSRCAYRTVCRVNQVRALGKIWQAPREEAPS
jgi:hypothetical protein